MNEALNLAEKEFLNLAEGRTYDTFHDKYFKMFENSLENEITTKFLVYDFLTKSYVDINRIFHKYNDKFVFHKNLFKRNSNKKRSIHFTQFYQKISPELFDSLYNLLQIFYHHFLILIALIH